MTASSNSGIVTLHGKQYQTVALRIRTFRDDFPLWSIETDLLGAGELVTVKASIKDETGRIIATGYAEEERASSSINATSAVENAETSAVGRALAFFGLGGTEIASADEVAGAISQQSGAEHLEYIDLVRRCWDGITTVKERLANDDIDGARVAFKDFDEDTQRALWKAPTKGGIFTVDERALLSTGAKPTRKSEAA